MGLRGHEELQHAEERGSVQGPEDLWEHERVSRAAMVRILLREEYDLRCQ